MKFYKFLKKNSVDLKKLENVEAILEDVLLSIPSYSIHEKDRLNKIIVKYQQDIRYILRIFEEEQLDFDYLLRLIRDDLLFYKKTLLTNIQFKDSPIICNHTKIELEYNNVNDSFVFTLPFSCKEDELTFFQEIQYLFNKKLELLHNSKDELGKKSGIKVIMEKFEKYLDLLKNPTKSFSHTEKLCQNLMDIFLILQVELPYILLTGNRIHFEPFCDILKTPVEYIR